MPSVLFNNIPGNIRVPLFYAEFNPGGTPYQSLRRLLLVGQMLSGGQADAGQAMLMRDGQADGLFGSGSMIAQMYKTARKNAPFAEIWCLPLADSAAGVVAKGSLVVEGAESVVQSGTLTFYVAGERLRLAVLSTDSDEAVASNVVGLVNGNPYLPVTAAIDPANPKKAILTAKHKGALGNDIALDLGLIGDEGPLGRQLLTVELMSGGSGDPEIEEGLSNLGAEEFDWIASPYADITNLGMASDFLDDVQGRWSPLQQLYGHYITVKSGSFGALYTLGDSRNDAHVSILGVDGSPTPPWIWAAALGGKAIKHLQTAPELSRPLQTLVLEDVLPPKNIADRFNLTERNSLYYQGISGYHTRHSGEVAIDRMLTTWQSNSWGDPDATYLDLNTIAQSMYGIRYLRQKFTNEHGRKALADENPTGNASIATPQDVKNTFIHGYRELVNLGVFEDVDLFARSLIVERDAADHNRLNAYLPLDHVNQLRIMAVNATNYMQRDRLTA